MSWIRWTNTPLVAFGAASVLTLLLFALKLGGAGFSWLWLAVPGLAVALFFALLIGAVELIVMLWGPR